MPQSSVPIVAQTGRQQQFSSFSTNFGERLFADGQPPRAADSPPPAQSFADHDRQPTGHSHWAPTVTRRPALSIRLSAKRRCRLPDRDIVSATGWIRNASASTESIQAALLFAPAARTLWRGKTYGLGRVDPHLQRLFVKRDIGNSFIKENFHPRCRRSNDHHGRN